MKRATQPRSWHFPRYRAEALRLSLERILARLSPTRLDSTDAEDACAAIALADGRPLAALARDPVDLATLPHAARSCAQYLRLRPGECAIVNEPFAGGTRLCDMTFAAVATPAGPGGPELLLAVRTRFPARASLDEKLDAEGVRIPPTPLGPLASPNAGVLAAIAAHPLAPAGFADAAARALECLREASARLVSAAQDPRSQWQAERLEDYLALEAEVFHERLARLPLGRSEVTSVLESGETLKLSLEVREDKVTFDFAGTDSSARAQLTDRATFGACFAAVCKASGAPIEGNAGAFAAVEVRTVPGSMVNAKAPVGFGRGMLDLSVAVAELALKGFAKNRASFRAASSARSFSRWQLAFEDGRVFSDGALGGSGATGEAPGLSASELDWSRGDGVEWIEKAEAEFPILFLGRGPRSGSGGGGRFEGGEGDAIRFEALAPAAFSWSLRHASGRVHGSEGGRAGAPADAAIERAGKGKRESLGPSGEARLEAGDVVSIRTAGGGGFGEKADAKDEEEASEA